MPKRKAATKQSAKKKREISDEEESNNQVAVAKKAKTELNGKASKKKNESASEEEMPTQHEEPSVAKKSKVKATKSKNKKVSESSDEEKEKSDDASGSDDKNDKPVAKKTKAKPKASEAKSSEPKEKMNKTESDLDDIDYGCEKVNENGEKYNLKISCWNVSGIRALIKKNGMDYFKKEKPDIIALQEVKCDQNKLPDEVKIPGYERYFLDSQKSGYCGVALYSKVKPINVKYGIKNSSCNDEGRIIMAEFEKFYLINVYVPNAGRKLVTMPKRLEWNKDLKNYVKELDAKKPVIICGDMNVAHQEIDLKNPKTNIKNAGFTKEERDGMTEFLAEGFVDTFRKLYPEKTGAYTFWSYMGNARSKNVGWRLDYFIVSERIVANVCDNVIRDKVYGSDHCPIVLYITM